MPTVITLAPKNNSVFIKVTGSTLNAALSASVSTDPGVTIIRLELSINGNSTVAYTNIVNHTENDIQLGTYTVSVKADDNNGITTIGTYTIYVKDKPDPPVFQAIEILSPERVRITFKDEINANHTSYRLQFTEAAAFTDSPVNFGSIFLPKTVNNGDKWGSYDANTYVYTFEIGPDVHIRDYYGTSDAMQAGFNFNFAVVAVTNVGVGAASSRSATLAGQLTSTKHYTGRVRSHVITGTVNSGKYTQVNTSPASTWYSIQHAGYFIWKNNFSIAYNHETVGVIVEARTADFKFGLEVDDGNRQNHQSGISDNTNTSHEFFLYIDCPGYLPTDAVWSTDRYYTTMPLKNTINTGYYSCSSDGSIRIRTAGNDAFITVTFNTKEIFDVYNGIDTYYEEIDGDITVALTFGVTTNTYTLRKGEDVDSQFITRRPITNNNTGRNGTYYAYRGPSALGMQWACDRYTGTTSRSGVLYGNQYPNGGILDNGNYVTFSGLNWSCEGFPSGVTVTFPGTIPPPTYETAIAERDYKARVNWFTGENKLESYASGDTANIRVMPWNDNRIIDFYTTGNNPYGDVFNPAGGIVYEKILLNFSQTKVPNPYVYQGFLYVEGYYNTWFYDGTDATDADTENPSYWIEAFTGKRGRISYPVSGYIIDYVRNKATNADLAYTVETITGSDAWKNGTWIKPKNILSTTKWITKYTWPFSVSTDYYYTAFPFPRGIRGDYSVDDNNRAISPHGVGTNAEYNKSVGRWISPAFIGKLKLRALNSGVTGKRWFYNMINTQVGSSADQNNTLSESLFTTHTFIQIPHCDDSWIIRQVSQTTLESEAFFYMLGPYYRDLFTFNGETISLEEVVRNINANPSLFGVEAQLTDIIAEVDKASIPTHWISPYKTIPANLANLDETSTNSNWGLPIPEKPDVGWADANTGWVEIPIYVNLFYDPLRGANRPNSGYVFTPPSGFRGILLPMGWGDGVNWNRQTEIRGTARARNHLFEFTRCLAGDNTNGGVGLGVPTEPYRGIGATTAQSGKIFVARAKGEIGATLTDIILHRYPGDPSPQIRHTISGSGIYYGIHTWNNNSHLLFVAQTSGTIQIYHSDNDFRSTTFGATYNGMGAKRHMNTYKDTRNGMIYMTTTDDLGIVKVWRFHPLGYRINFPDGNLFKQIVNNGAFAAAITGRNGVLIVSWNDEAGNVYNLKSQNGGVTWS